MTFATKKNINKMLLTTKSCRSCGNLSIYSVPANKQSFLKLLIGDAFKNHTRCGEGGKAEILVADHKKEELSKPFIFCYFLKLLMCPGSQSLPLSLNLFIINMDETWGESEKKEAFLKWQQQQSASWLGGTYGWCAAVVCILYSSQGKWIMILCLWVA